MTDASPLAGDCLCGATGWTLTGDPGLITACNCTLCRRYGALWAYDFENERIAVRGAPRHYARPRDGASLEILFCPTCACLLAWRGTGVDDEGRRRMAVNIRLAESGPVADLAIDHFDGLDTFEDLASDGRCVRDMWF